MIMLTIQTFLLLLIVAIVGFLMGCLLHRWLGAKPAQTTASGLNKTAQPQSLVTDTGDSEEARKSREEAEAAAKAKAEAEEKARAEEAAARAKAEAEEKARAEEAAAKAKAEAEEKARAEEAAAKAKAEAEEKARAEEAAAKAKAEAEEKARADEAAAKAKAEAEEKAGAEASTGSGGGQESGTPVFLAAPEGGKADDLKRIKGIGPKLEQTLNDLGVFHFAQIAVWTEENIEWMDDYLTFKGRIKRDDWISQAKLLASGAETEFSKRVDKGDVPSSQ